MHYSVMSLPEGYDTKVGEAGVKLSSGEKQKIALARAILKGAPVILLDEVTKSTDQESKISIQEAIKGIKDKKTIITVTHQMNEIVEGSNVVFLGKRAPLEMEKAVFENS